jgi:acetyl-CoA acyltransferase 1
MGVGPAVAIPKLLDYTGLTTEDVNVWEINEAFASQALYCVRKLGLENKMDRINPNGGAIALGHPLGATSGRMLATLLSEMGRSGEQVGVLSKCIGTGMGMASLIVRE